MRRKMHHIEDLIGKIEAGWFRCKGNDCTAFSLTEEEASNLIPHLKDELAELYRTYEIWEILTNHTTKYSVEK